MSHAMKTFVHTNRDTHNESNDHGELDTSHMLLSSASILFFPLCQLTLSGDGITLNDDVTYAEIATSLRQHATQLTCRYTHTSTREEIRKCDARASSSSMYHDRRFGMLLTCACMLL
jgi:hypothetical protein